MILDATDAAFGAVVSLLPGAQCFDDVAGLRRVDVANLPPKHWGLEPWLKAFNQLLLICGFGKIRAILCDGVNEA